MSAPSATGKVFLSYKRERKDEVRRFAEALQEVGVEVWQDVRNLGAGRTNEEIRRALTGSEMAGAVLWITPEVEGSDVILQVEVPEALARSKGGGFFVLPVAAGGLDWQGAAKVVRSAVLGSLGEWNIEQAPDPLAETAAAELARRVLSERLAQVDRALPADEPLRLGLYTRADAHASPGHHLLLDWRHRFEERVARPGAWEAHLLPALRDVAREVGARAPGRAVHARGLLSLAAATALGAAFVEPKGIELGWWQYSRGSETLWSLRGAEEDSGFTAEVEDGDLGSSEVAVCLSVVEDVRPCFQVSQADLPSFRQRIFLERQRDYPQELTPGEGAHLARLTVRALRQARPFQRAHLFLAGPAGLAVLVGRLLNTLPEVQTYELVAGKYRPAALLRP